jgi:TonB-dependent SusC/RagA subfamily outer membrane receptor
MKKTVLILALIVICRLLALSQIEKEFKPTISKVTVFPTGAQIESEAQVSLIQGKMILKFTNLSPYIKSESIRIDGDESYIIESVQLQNDYLNELEKNKEVDNIKSNVEDLKNKIELEQTWIKILNEKLDFLKTNMEIAGKQQAVSPEIFNSMNSIFGNNLETLNLDILKRTRTLEEYKKQMEKYNNQLTSLNNKTNLPSGNIVVSIESKKTVNSKIKFSYLVSKASWFPSYDIRFIAVDKPLKITFKANITQNTGVDWENISLVLSTTKTNISAQIPKLSPFYLQFYYPQIVSSFQARASGIQVSDSITLADANPGIRIRGIKSLDTNNDPLYVVDGIVKENISSLNPNDIDNIQVLKDASATSIYGSRGANGVILITTRQTKESSSIPLTVETKREISKEYEVQSTQTILSKNKINTITFKEENLKAIFEYHTVPSLSEYAYLIGKVSDLYKTDLIDGDANIYLENSYVGRSYINAKQFNDTLDISFGVDNNINVKRERMMEFSENQLLGLNRKETIGYKTTLRNQKSYPITIKVLDQIPVSTTKNIQVETIDISGGNLNNESGEVKWIVELKPSETKNLIIKYSAKYPRNKMILFE